MNEFQIAARMLDAGLPRDFIHAILSMAATYNGALQLLQLWEAEDDPAEREQIIADLQDLLDAAAEQPGRRERYVRFDDLELISSHIMAFKSSLLKEVERRGTLTQLSEKTKIPLPSLSRFFNTSSMPRRRTLEKIAEALDLSAVEIATDWSH